MESHDSPTIHGTIVCIVNNNINNKWITHYMPGVLLLVFYFILMRIDNIIDITVLIL